MLLRFRPIFADIASVVVGVMVMWGGFLVAMDMPNLLYGLDYITEADKLIATATGSLIGGLLTGALTRRRTSESLVLSTAGLSGMSAPVWYASRSSSVIDWYAFWVLAQVLFALGLLLERWAAGHAAGRFESGFAWANPPVLLACGFLGFVGSAIAIPNVFANWSLPAWWACASMAAVYLLAVAILIRGGRVPLGGFLKWWHLLSVRRFWKPPDR